MAMQANSINPQILAIIKFLLSIMTHLKLVNFLFVEENRLYSSLEVLCDFEGKF
jgi:hypothetical protein